MTPPYDHKSYLPATIPKTLKIEPKQDANKYNCVVTNVDLKTGQIFFRFLAPIQTFDATRQIQTDLQNFYAAKTTTNDTDVSYSYNFIRESLKKAFKLACVCKFKDDKFYRCEIMNEINEKESSTNKKFFVFSVDYGFEAVVSLDALFRPFNSHLFIERQVFTFKLNPTLEKFSKQVNKDNFSKQKIILIYKFYLTLIEFPAVHAKHSEE